MTPTSGNTHATTRSDADLVRGDRRLSVRLSGEAVHYYPGDFELRVAVARALNRAGLGVAAIAMARAAIVLRPDADDDIHLMSWRESMRTKDARGAERIIRRWKTLSLSDQAFRAGCDSAAIGGDAFSFVETVLQAMDRGHNLFDWQHRLAQLSNLLNGVPRKSSDDTQVALASKIIGHPVFSMAFRRASVDRGETDAALRDRLDDITDRDLHGGLEALLSSDLPRAAAGFGRFAASGSGLPVSLSQLIPDGPDQGHPVWHVANPYFRIWAEATTDEDTQVNWQTNPVLANVLSGTPGERYAD